MVLYFDKNGRLLEYLEYDDSARVGTTNFKIFAFFENLDDYDTYGLATIRLKRPDLQGSEYPDLFMIKYSFNYDEDVEASQYFKEANNPYKGFVFNFGSITNENIEDEEDENENEEEENTISIPRYVRLLDMPGIWEASITLQSTERANVTGLIRFTVEPSVSGIDDEDDGADNTELIISNVKDLLISDYVPYEGATKPLNLGSRALIADTIESHANPNNYINLNGEDENLNFVADNGVYAFYSSEGMTTYIHNNATDDRDITLPDASGEIALINSIPNLAIVVNTLTNINGWFLSNYESTPFMFANTYMAYRITRGGEKVTEEQARIYMEAMTGSRFLPVYDYHKPLNSYFITISGELLKPQYSEEDGLLLFKMTTLPLNN